MRTRSSSNLPGESPPNQPSSNQKRRNHRRSKQPFILEESPVNTMADQRTMAELLRAYTEGYAEAIVVPPIFVEQFELMHSLINMMTLDQFFGLENDNPHDHICCALNPADQDSLNSTTGGNLLKRSTQDVLTIIENKSKIAKLTHAINQQTSAVTTAMTTILKQFQATPPPAFIKAIEEICVNYGGAHPYYQCLTTCGNTFSELRDNIQGYANMKAMQTQINNVKNKLRNEMKNSFQASMSNQTNELKNMMASFFQMNTASSSSSGHLPSSTIANPKGEIKSITTRSGIVLDGPFVPIPPSFINPGEDERVEETLTDQDLAEYTIKVPPPLVQKPKPPSQIKFVVHQKDPLHPNIPYPSRMHKQKQQEKDEVQIHKFWQMFKQLHINITLADALILMPKYQNMLKALLSNKEKLLEMANTPLNENCSAVILKKLPEKLGDPGKFLNPCGFNELKCKALTDLANRAICTPAGIARDVFVSVGMFTFPADFVIVDYESDPRVLLILGRPFLRTTHALIDVHGEEMILCDEGGNVLIEKVINLDSTKDLSPPHNVNPLSGSTTYSSSPNNLLEEFAEELALITFPPNNDDLPFDIESDLKEIEYLLNNDPIKEIDSILEDPVDEDNLASFNDNLADTMPEMFIDEHDLTIIPIGEKIKESKLLINNLISLDQVISFLLPSMTRFSLRISKVDALPSIDNEDKVFNPGILIQENLFEVNTRVAPDKNVKTIAISHVSLILEDFDPPLYELPFLKEVLGSETLLSFSSENEETVFKPGILTSKGFHFSIHLEISHRGHKVFKIIKILEIPIEIFPCFCGENIRILDVPCLHFYPP
nr:hypothetical protein [Tanacetum cinerariifolium]